MNLADILSQIEAGSDRHRLAIPGNWLQGRTCYGGLSSTIAYQAAKLAEPGLPPLKSAQIAFAGPLSGEVEVSTTMLRRGRNSAFVKSDIQTGDETGLSCSFVFMNDRESHVAFEDIPPPEFPPLPKDDELRSGPPEFFTSNMQYAGARLELGMQSPNLGKWQRITERDGLDPIAEILCLADGLPPSAMGLMTEKGAVSSMTWQANLLTSHPQTSDGWWFIDSRTHFAGNGTSSQYMTLWNSDRQPVMTGMQSVAIFS